MMRIADTWKDYELLDCSEGERLERWGSVILIRPDPQVIWKTGRTDPRWSRADARYLRSSSGGGRWEVYHRVPDVWAVHYGELQFRIKTMGFKHTGLFPEQAVNWDMVADTVKKAARPVKMLNLFAYTGAATVSALRAGAAVTHVDASKGMVQWARENAEVSGVAGGEVRWLVDDCLKFVEREIRRGNRYDIIVMDPPSYGRGPGGEVWKLEDEVYNLTERCSRLLDKNSLLFLLNSYTTGLSPSVMQYILACTVQQKYGGVTQSDEIGLPVSASQLVLPCGSTACWKREI